MKHDKPKKWVFIPLWNSTDHYYYYYYSLLLSYLHGRSLVPLGPGSQDNSVACPAEVCDGKGQ